MPQQPISKQTRHSAILTDLLSKIERGTWSVNERFPTETDLQKLYNVSRGTIRGVLNEIEARGYILRKSGRGTLVIRVTPRIEKPQSEIASFSQQMAIVQYQASSRVLDKGIIRASEAQGRVREAFGIPEDTEIIHIKRLRSGNMQPFAIQSVYLLPALCPNILEADLSSLFTLYNQRYERRITSSDEVLHVGRASQEEAELLEIKTGDPVVIRDRISFDQHERPFEVLHSIDRGDRYTYRYQIVNDQTHVPQMSEMYVG
jgi:GntR family transcriptional regulator